MARYTMTDDSVTVRGKGSPKYSGKSITRRGERALQPREEAGRSDLQTARGRNAESTGSNRPARTSTARDVTSVNPQDPIDPRMPNLR